MSCSSCASSASAARMQGHFGAYVPAGPAQIFRSTGQVVSAPNETAGMRVNRLSPRVTGLGATYFGVNQTNLIDGIANEYLALGAVAVLVLVMMR